MTKPSIFVEELNRVAATLAMHEQIQNELQQLRETCNRLPDGANKREALELLYKCKKQFICYLRVYKTSIDKKQAAMVKWFYCRQKKAMQEFTELTTAIAAQLQTYVVVLQPDMRDW